MKCLVLTLTSTYNLSLHDALPISQGARRGSDARDAGESRIGQRGPSAAPDRPTRDSPASRSEEHTSELQSRRDLVCRLLLEKKKNGKTLASIFQGVDSAVYNSNKFDIPLLADEMPSADIDIDLQSFPTRRSSDLSRRSARF